MQVSAVEPAQDLTDIKIALAKLLVNQENYMALFKTHLDQFKEHAQDDKVLAARITSLESKAWQMTGALAVLALVWGVVSHKVIELLGLK